MAKVLVDSNILVYSIQRDAGKKHEISSTIIAELTASQRMCVSIQNLAEFSRIVLEKISPPLNPETASGHVADFSKFSSTLRYNGKTILLAISISRQYRLHFFDALLAATMQENGIEEILTENVEDFSKIPWINAKNPFKWRSLKTSQS